MTGLIQSMSKASVATEKRVPADSTELEQHTITNHFPFAGWQLTLSAV